MSSMDIRYISLASQAVLCTVVERAVLGVYCLVKLITYLCRSAPDVIGLS